MPDTITRLGALYENGMRALMRAMDDARGERPLAAAAVGEPIALPMVGAAMRPAASAPASSDAEAAEATDESAEEQSAPAAPAR